MVLQNVFIILLYCKQICFTPAWRKLDSHFATPTLGQSKRACKNIIRTNYVNTEKEKKNKSFKKNACFNYSDAIFHNLKFQFFK